MRLPCPGDTVNCLLIVMLGCLPDSKNSLIMIIEELHKFDWISITIRMLITEQGKPKLKFL